MSRNLRTPIVIILSAFFFFASINAIEFPDDFGDFIPNPSVKATSLHSVTIGWKVALARAFPREYKLSIINLEREEEEYTLFLTKRNLTLTMEEKESYNAGLLSSDQDYFFVKIANYYYVIDNLRAETSYKLGVSACLQNHIICGDYGTIQVRTMDRDPKFVPTVVVVASNYNSIRIGWLGPPSELHDRVHQYKVVAYSAGYNSGPKYLPESARDWVFENLQNDRSYYPKVAACSEYKTQCGSLSTQQEVWLADSDYWFIPNIWVTATTSNSITIEWSRPPPLKVYYRVNQYKVMMTLCDKIFEPVYLVGTVTSHVFENLTSEASYHFRVAACRKNPTRCNSWSFAQEGLTRDRDPKFIPTVSVIATTLDSVTIGWSTPPPALQHRVYQYKVMASHLDGLIYLNKTLNSRVFRNLTSETSYRFKVAACSDYTTQCAGWSSEAEAQTIDRDPKFIPTVSVNGTSLHSIKIEWSTPPPQLRDRVHQYKVTARHQTETTRTVYLDKTVYSYVFGNLTSRTSYLLRVAACSDYVTQCGNWSSEQEVLTIDEEKRSDDRFRVYGSPCAEQCLGILCNLARRTIPYRVNAVTADGQERTQDVLWPSLGVIVVLLVIVLLWMIVQKCRKNAARKKFMEETLKRFNAGAVDCLNPELNVGDQAELLPYNKKWEYPRELLKFDKTLGSGAFGIVKKAQARSICRSEAVTTVAVKMVRATSRLNEMTALSRELKILAYLGKHVNVVNLLGACTKNVSYGELFVIVEFCRFGNLRDYLIRCRADFVDHVDTPTENVAGSSSGTDRSNGLDTGVETLVCDSGPATEVCFNDTDARDASVEVGDCVPGADSGEPGLRSKYEGDYAGLDLEPIDTQDLLSWAWQVSRGMKYLGSRRILHGDLAARNILLADKNVVKICDFGLAKALYTDENYKQKDHAPLPVKWMAMESLKDRIFSVKSDVWSFGIVMWEFFSLGETPYPGIGPRYVLQKLVDGYRMPKPEHATRDIYKMMLACWDATPSKRPSFDKLAQSLDNLLDEGVKKDYVDLSAEYMQLNAAASANEDHDYLMMSPADDSSDEIEGTPE